MTHAAIGLVVIFGIVLLPVYLFLLAAFFGKPRAPGVAILMLGLPAGLLALSLAGMWLLGSALSLVVP